MIFMIKNKKEEIDQVIKILETAEDDTNPAGLINYTVPVCLVKSKILVKPKQKEHYFKPEEYVLVVDFATYIPSLGDANDSPGGKLIDIEEHKSNCKKIIGELREMRARL